MYFSFHVLLICARLVRNGTNCLKTTENHSPSTEMRNLTNQQYGEIYSADEQCRIVYGSGSYLCRVGDTESFISEVNVFISRTGGT